MWRLGWRLLGTHQLPPCRCAPGTRSFAQISHSEITQSCFGLSDSLMNAVTCLSDASSLLFLLPLCASSHFLPPSLSRSHMQPHSADQSAWIELMARGLFCWRRHCQIRWVIGELCLAATLSGVVIHFVNRDLELLSRQLPPSLPPRPGAARGDGADVAKCVINAFQWVYSPTISIDNVDIRIETFPRFISLSVI